MLDPGRGGQNALPAVNRRAAALAVLLLGLVDARAAEPAAAPAPSTAAAVRIRDKAVVELHASWGDRTPEVRAREASEALGHALEMPGADRVRMERIEDGMAILAGPVPVLRLGRADARASGTEDLALYAASVTARLDAAYQAERRRLAIQARVFAFSLLVFSGLIAFLALRGLGTLGGQVGTAILEDRERIPAFHLGSVEVASRRAMRGGVALAFRIGTRLLQLLVVYLWLLFALSLFATTQDFGARLTASVLRPAAAILGRLGAALPALAVAVVLALVVALVVRTLRLFFASVSSGETQVRWMPADLAEPVGMLLRAAVLVLALVFAAPLVTGSEGGALSQVALVALVGLGLGLAPLLASMVVGLPTVFGRTLPRGEMVEVGGRQGQVRQVTLLEILLEDAQGAEVRVPHLATLLRPSRRLGPVPRVSFEVVVSGTADPAKVGSVLLEVAGSHASGARAELVSLDAAGARWRVTGIHPDLGARIAVALRDAGIALGKPGWDVA
jgi:small-conductance mechanosensitive channel